MKERILEFLKAENKSSAQFADEIGVQPSGISHILSGRNNPSLDFIMKMLEKYRFLSTEWLLFGRGTMYKDTKMQSLFDEFNSVNTIDNSGSSVKTSFKDDDDITDNKTDKAEIHNKEQESVKTSDVKSIVWFFKDNSFKEYYPG
jgi:transcriptional regulator with XRE-family HTH domain